jgi:hypothetical protein
LLALLLALACEERFTGPEGEAGGGPEAGAPNAGTFGDGGATGGASSSGGKGGSGGSAGSKAGAPASGGASAGGTSGGSSANGGEGGEPGEVEPEIPTEGLLLWLRADRGVTQTEGVVDKWEDGSGASNHATQSANNVRPLLVAEAFGSRPAIEFDGEDFLRLPEGFSDFSKGLSVFAFTQFDAMTTCSALFHLGNGPEVDDIELGQFNGDFLYEVADQYPVSDLFAFGTPALMTLVHRPTTSVEMRWNQDLGANPTVTLPAAVTRTENVVGRSLYVDCSSMGGKLAELILYNRAVSDDELVEIELYLQQRYDCCSE